MQAPRGCPRGAAHLVLNHVNHDRVSSRVHQPPVLIRAEFVWVCGCGLQGRQDNAGHLKYDGPHGTFPAIFLLLTACDLLGVFCFRPPALSPAFSSRLIALAASLRASPTCVATARRATGPARAARLPLALRSAFRRSPAGESGCSWRRIPSLPSVKRIDGLPCAF